MHTQRKLSVWQQLEHSLSLSLCVCMYDGGGGWWWWSRAYFRSSVKVREKCMYSRVCNSICLLCDRDTCKCIYRCRMRGKYCMCTITYAYVCMYVCVFMHGLVCSKDIPANIIHTHFLYISRLLCTAIQVRLGPSFSPCHSVTYAEAPTPFFMANSGPQFKSWFAWLVSLMGWTGG